MSIIGIFIVDLKEDNHVEWADMSGNWSKYSGRKRPLKDFDDYFSLREIHGHDGVLVIRKLKESLVKLLEDGYAPSKKMRVNRYGNVYPKYYKDKTIEIKEIIEEEFEVKTTDGYSVKTAAQLWKDPEFEKDRKCMFAYQLKKFLQLAELHPECYWYAHRDHKFKVLPLYGDPGKEPPKDGSLRRLGSKA